MTYKELLDLLNELDEEQLNMDVTIYDTEEDEFFKSAGFNITDETDILDENHPYLTL